MHCNLYVRRLILLAGWVPFLSDFFFSILDSFSILLPMNFLIILGGMPIKNILPKMTDMSPCI